MIRLPVYFQVSPEHRAEFEPFLMRNNKPLTSAKFRNILWNDGNGEQQITVLEFIPSKYEDGGNPGAGDWNTYFYGNYKSINAIRKSINIECSDNLYPLRLLFERMRDTQGSTAFAGCYKLIRIWDYRGYENPSADLSQRVTLREGSIFLSQNTGIAAREGAMVCLEDGTAEAQPVPNARDYCEPFTITFTESIQRYAY
jgi:hypothetical protein